MALYIILGTYSNKGSEGLVEGSSDRRKAMETLTSSVGVKLINYHITRQFDDHSLISSIINKNFSIPGIDRSGNTYLITSNGNQLLVNSISVEELDSKIDFIFTDLLFDHPGKFPILTLSNSEVSTSNNKIQSTVDISYNFNFDSNIYIIKKKWEF